MEKLDLAILIDNSSWTLMSFISAGGDNLRQNLETDLRKLDVDFRLACVQYGGLNQARANDSHARTDGFCSTLPENFLENCFTSDDALTIAIEKTCNLDWRKEARKICFLITDNPPSMLSTEYIADVDILEITRKLGGKGIVLNTIGIEPRLKPYKDFFMALSYITGGRYIALTDPSKFTAIIIGATQEDTSLEKILHLVDQNEVDCIRNIGPSMNDIGQFYNGCDQHFIDFYKEMVVDEKPPTTTHFRDSNYKNVFVTPLARYLSTLPSLDELRKKCLSWPLPWPVQYHLPYQVPHYCCPGPPPPPGRVFQSPPKPAESSVPKSETPTKHPPPPPPPPPPLPEQSPVVSSCKSSASETSSTSPELPVRKAPAQPTKSITARQPSTAPPPPGGPFKVSPPPPPPHPGVNVSTVNEAPYLPPTPPPPPRPERRLPLRRQWPPNPREQPYPDGPSTDRYEMHDPADRPAMPFEGGFCFKLQYFSTLQAPPTYGQLHRLVQRALVRGIFKQIEK